MPVKKRILKSGRKVYDVKASIRGRQYMKRGFRTLKAAEQWEKDLLDRRDGLAPKITVEQLAWLYLEDAWLRLAESTVKDYAIQLDLRILPAIRHLKISEVRPPQLQEIVNASRGRRIPGKTATTLKAIFSSAVRWGLLDTSPAVYIRAPGPRKREMAFLTQEQASALLRASEGLIHLYVLLGLSTGMRPEELRGLRWEDVEGRKVRVRKAKTAAGIRTVTIPTRLAQILKVQRSKEGYIFNMDGAPWTPYNLRWRFERALKAAGLEDKGFTPHSLRHTYSAWCMSEGISVKFIQQTLGHTDPSFTMKEYGHLVPGTAEAITDGIEAVSNLYQKESEQEDNIIEFPN